MVVNRSTKMGHLYFIRSPSQDAVKVGFAVDWYTRHATLQSGNPAKLQQVAVIPAQGACERVFHAYMRPHRLVREWYPDDTLMFFLACEFLELWGDAVVEKAGRDTWHETGDEFANPAGVYLTADWMDWALPLMVDRFYMPEPPSSDPDDPTAQWPDDEAPPNRWADRKKGRLMKPRLMGGTTVPVPIYDDEPALAALTPR